MNIHRNILASTCIAAVSAATLQAATPQEVYAQLAQPAQIVSVSPEARMKVLPALAHLPLATDGILALPNFGAVLTSMGADKHLACIGSVVVSAGAGSAAAMEYFLSAVDAGVSSQNIDLLKMWRSLAKEREGEVIRKTFKALKEQHDADMMAALKQLRLAPLYVAITAEPGCEQDFAQMAEMFMSALDSIADDCEDWKSEECYGFKGVYAAQEKLFDKLMENTRKGSVLAVKKSRRKELRQVFEGREIHLLAKYQDGVLLVSASEKPTDLSWPKDAAASLLSSPALSGADAHLDNLKASMWVAPRMMQSFVKLARNKSVVDGAVAVFRALAKDCADNASSYLAAAKGLEDLCSNLIPAWPSVKVAQSCQVWGGGKELYVEIMGDAMGSSFVPGELQYTSVAAEPTTLLYAETTEPRSSVSYNFSGLVQTAFDVAKAVVLTTPEEIQDRVSYQIQMAQMFAPDVEALGAGLCTTLSGLSAPCALVVGDVNPVAVAPGVALCAAVKDRSAISSGWNQMLGVVQQVATKLGAGNIVASLPIMSKSVGDATSYVVAMPLPPGVEPQVTLNDKRFIAGTSSMLNQHLLGTQGGTPFCGAVATFRAPALKQFLDRTQGANPHRDAVLSRLRAVHAVSTVNDGVSVMRALIEKSE